MAWTMLAQAIPGARLKRPRHVQLHKPTILLEPKKTFGHVANFYLHVHRQERAVRLYQVSAWTRVLQNTLYMLGFLEHMLYL